AVYVVLSGRLYQLQIVERGRYLTSAEENRVNHRLLVPPRGGIYERFGTELAGKRRNYSILIIPEQGQHGLEPALDSLARIVPATERQKERVIKEAKQNKSFAPIVVADNLSWEEFARLNLDLPYLQGVQLDVGETRN